RRRAALPSRIHRNGPWRIVRHSQNVFDHVCTPDVASESETQRGLAVTFYVPRHAKPRLESGVHRIDQRFWQVGRARLVGLNQPAERIVPVKQARNVVAYPIVIGVSRRESRPPQSKSQGQVLTNLPGIVAIEFEVVPPAERVLLVVELRV